MRPDLTMSLWWPGYEVCWRGDVVGYAETRDEADALLDAERVRRTRYVPCPYQRPSGSILWKP